MGEIKVDSGILRSKASEFRNYVSSFDQEKQKLSEAEQKMMGGFEGDAATAFNSNFQAFYGQLENFKTVVEQYVVELEASAEAYEKAEEKSAQIAVRK